MNYRFVGYLTTLFHVHWLYTVELIGKMNCEFVAMELSFGGRFEVIFLHFSWKD
jgi:hypothetical protein